MKSIYYNRVFCLTVVCLERYGGGELVGRVSLSVYTCLGHSLMFARHMESDVMLWISYLDDVSQIMSLLFCD